LLVIAQDAGLTNCLQARLLDIAAGRTYQEIAEARSIAVSTVKSEVSTLLHALNVPCKDHIVTAARAAARRAEMGATIEQIVEFLYLRFE
jgi:DNA-binding NarL/FixJ family response regulator